MKNRTCRDDLAKELLEAICEASHDAGRKRCQNGFVKSVRSECDDWALLFKGYELLFNENYEAIDKDFKMYVQCLSGRSPAEAQQSTCLYLDLADLLFAHVLRRKADLLLEEAKVLLEINTKEDCVEPTKVLRKRCDEIL